MGLIYSQNERDNVQQLRSERKHEGREIALYFENFVEWKSHKINQELWSTHKGQFAKSSLIDCQWVYCDDPSCLSWESVWILLTLDNTT